MEKNKKSGGFLGGLILILIGIMILSFNEGRTVKTQSAINEALKSYSDVTSETIDSKNEGKLIATTGKIDLSESSELKDGKFGISVKAAKLQRYVEMYQWQESCETDENDNKNCTYEKVWSDKLINSSEFSKSGYTNPTSFKYESDNYLATNVKVGAYELPERLLDNLSYNKELKNENLTDLYKVEVENFKINDNYITNAANTEDYQIGDLRISYKYASDGEVSLLGIQKGNTLTAFTGKKGKSIFTIKRGSYTGRELLVSMTNQNKNAKWFLRILGTVIVMLGVGSLFNPLQVLGSKIPVIGSIINASTSIVSTILGLSISLIVIAIAWFRYRPLLSIILLLIVVGLLVFLKLKNKNQNPEKETKK